MAPICQFHIITRWPTFLHSALAPDAAADPVTKCRVHVQERAVMESHVTRVAVRAGAVSHVTRVAVTGCHVHIIQL